VFLELDSTREHDTDTYTTDFGNNRVQLDKPGMYLITGAVQWDSDASWSTADTCSPRPVANGNIHNNGQYLKIGTADQQVPINPTPLTLAAGDTVACKVYQDSGGSRPIQHGLPERTGLVIIRLRPPK